MWKKKLLILGIVILIFLGSLFFYGYFSAYSGSLSTKNFLTYSKFFFSNPSDAFVFLYQNTRSKYDSDYDREINPTKTLRKNDEFPKSNENTVVYSFNSADSDVEYYLGRNSEILKMVAGDGYFDNDNWDYTKYPVFVSVSDIKLDGLSVGVYIDKPDSQSFSRKLKYVSIDCPADKTFLLDSMTRKILKENFNVNDELQVSDGLVTYCSNASCDSFVKECVIDRASFFTPTP